MIFIYTFNWKTIRLTFDLNFGKCRPIYQMLLLSDSWGNFVHTHHKDYPLYLRCFYTTLWNLTITTAAELNSILHVNSSCKMWDRLNNLGLNAIIMNLKNSAALGATTVTFWQWWSDRSRLLHQIHGVCRQIIFPTFLRYLHSVLHELHKN